MAGWLVARDDLTKVRSTLFNPHSSFSDVDKYILAHAISGKEHKDSLNTWELLAAPSTLAIGVTVTKVSGLIGMCQHSLWKDLPGFWPQGSL